MSTIERTGYSNSGKQPVNNEKSTDSSTKKTDLFVQEKLDSLPPLSQPVTKSTFRKPNPITRQTIMEANAKKRKQAEPSEINADKEDTLLKKAKVDESQPSISVATLATPPKELEHLAVYLPMDENYLQSALPNLKSLQSSLYAYKCSEMVLAYLGMTAYSGQMKTHAQVNNIYFKDNSQGQTRCEFALDLHRAKIMESDARDNVLFKKAFSQCQEEYSKVEAILRSEITKIQRFLDEAKEKMERASQLIESAETYEKTSEKNAENDD